ncbi:MAG: hypothetical protein LBK58_05300 [Prevotellaceae bacterium]|jgi:hypothetical protein|nr:hypothetical protein [Prevotellaceae bacterium]
MAIKFKSVMDIDTVSYSKIRKGERYTRKEHILIIVKILQADLKELLVFWFGNQIITVMKDEKNIAGKALKLQKIKQIILYS